MAEVGSKRGWLLRQEGALLAAGAFSREPVRFDATAPDGTAGFSAHRSRAHTHLYRPCHLPMFTVRLSGLRDDCHPDYLLGRRQQVMAIELNALCSAWGCTTPADAWSWGRWEHDREPEELIGQCRDHGGGPPADITALGVDVRVLDERISRHVRRYEQAPRRRGCPCPAVDALTARAGLRLYVSDLRDMQNPDAVHSQDLRDLACRECGARWRYDRLALRAEKLRPGP